MIRIIGIHVTTHLNLDFRPATVLHRAGVAWCYQAQAPTPPPPSSHFHSRKLIIKNGVVPSCLFSIQGIPWVLINDDILSLTLAIRMMTLWTFKLSTTTIWIKQAQLQILSPIFLEWQYFYLPITRVKCSDTIYAVVWSWYWDNIVSSEILSASLV